MKMKNFLISGITGGIVNFLLGWLFYGILFRDQFPGEMPNMLFIFFGCMIFGVFIAYIFTKWASITKFTTGMNAGATIGLFLALWSNFFMRANSLEVDYKNMLLDIAISMVLGALVGATVAIVNGKLSERK